MRKKSILKIGGILAAGVLIGKLIALLINSPAIQTRMNIMNAPGKIREYSRTHPVRKLQLGAGGQDYPGWLNTDIRPGPAEVYLDATRPFPIPDGSIHYIFGEHVIEHLSYDDGLLMLRECSRVLAPGGKIRFATPNLLKYVQLFQEPKTDEMQSYLGRKLEFQSWPKSSRPEATILNREMRSFYHKYLYDPQTLSDRFAAAGFRAVAQFPPGESDDPQLRGIESRHTNFWRPVNDYESMCLQASRP
jgi:predicted SAM-dependent methyltransferase